jgi:hypothetical protein
MIKVEMGNIPAGSNCFSGSPDVPSCRYGGGLILYNEDRIFLFGGKAE